MPERAQIRFLLDEHYPGWLAEGLAADGVEAVALTAHRPGLRGADDQRVLEAAVAEGRVVVTEDVSTFSAAAALVQAVRELNQEDSPSVTASVGIFCFDDPDGVSEHHAMVGADLAMYAAKHAGRDRHAPLRLWTSAPVSPTM